MSAAEVIEQIKALPPHEREVVRDFVLQSKAEEKPRMGKYMTDAQAKAAGDVVLEQYNEVFRKLSQ